jgi:ATP-dependent RNA helicase DeaD
VRSRIFPTARNGPHPERKHMTEFNSVLPALGQALTRRGYTVLTPVQEAVLAEDLVDADVLVSAQTGSGKTVAFGMAIAPTLLGQADRFGSAASPLALAIAPTRELALQVRRELAWLFELTGARLASCVGGMDMREERRALSRGAHIVVGTPGRLRDHIERGSLDLSGLRAVVLDEADEMLDLGFRDDLEFILGAAPENRRTLMFSATVPRSIEALAGKYQRDAVRLNLAAENKQHLDIEYRALSIAPRDQEKAIINVLRYFDARNALVFCGTRATVNHLTSRFNNRGMSVVALSGELSQAQRTHALQAMRDGRARVCVATDVAARGIDLPDLELVIHAEIPKSREILLHRSGRTGRAGRKGVSALIVPQSAARRTERLLKSAGIDATWAKPPSVEDVRLRDDERILEDPALSEPVTEAEAGFVADILQRHGAEQVAAALVRRFRAGQSAPEELTDIGPAAARAKTRDDFQGGVWFSLSVGRKHNAEPRWLLPMLCKSGDVSKGEIGAIRVQDGETFVELAPAAEARFLAALGKDGTLEGGIKVARLEGIPAGARSATGKQGGSRKPYKARSTGGRDSDRQRQKSKDKPRSGTPDRFARPNPKAEESAKQKPRKPHKKKIARAALRAAKAGALVARKPKKTKPM